MATTGTVLAQKQPTSPVPAATRADAATLSMFDSVVKLLTTCQHIPSEERRLSCYDEAASLAQNGLDAVAGAAPLLAKPGWRIMLPGDGASVTAYNWSEIRSGDIGRVRIVLSCRDGVTNVAMEPSFDHPLLGNDRPVSVSYRVADSTLSPSMTWEPNGRVFTAPEVGNEDALIRQMAAAGSLSLTITQTGGFRGTYQFDTRDMDVVVADLEEACDWRTDVALLSEIRDLPDFAPFQDWFFYTRAANGTQYCIVASTARGGDNPPLMLFEVDRNRETPTMNFRLLNPNYFDPDRPAEAVVDGRRFVLSFDAEGDLIPEITRTEDGRKFVNGDIVEAIRRGRTIELRGTGESSNASISFVFSASGFTQTFNHMMSECDRPDLAGWLD